MADLPEVETLTVAAIWAGIVVNEGERWESIGLTPGSLADDCSRKLYYSFRWASPPEDFTGQKLSIFQTGNVWEWRLVWYLHNAGMTVRATDPETGGQYRVRMVGGHLRGKTDGEVNGVPEAPVTTHLLECKSHKHKSFMELKRKKVAEGKPAHYGQVQTYMHARGYSRALYVAVDKDTDELYSERVEYDAAYALTLMAKGERIVTSERPPPKLHEDPDAKMAWQCKFCPAAQVCHFGAEVRRNCRTCLHSTAALDGDARWTCDRWSKDLTIEEQRAGCPKHLFIPDLVPGEQIDADEAAETISYRLADGSTWVDGGRAA